MEEKENTIKPIRDGKVEGGGKKETFGKEEEELEIFYKSLPIRAVEKTSHFSFSSTRSLRSVL